MRKTSAWDPREQLLVLVHNTDLDGLRIWFHLEGSFMYSVKVLKAEMLTFCMQSRCSIPVPWPLNRNQAIGNIYKLVAKRKEGGKWEEADRFKNWQQRKKKRSRKWKNAIVFLHQGKKNHLFLKRRRRRYTFLLARRGRKTKLGPPLLSFPITQVIFIRGIYLNHSLLCFCVLKFISLLLKCFIH